MDITFLGHAAFRLKGKSASLVTDPFDPKVGLKFPKVEADIVTVSHEHFDHNASGLVGGAPYIINGAGEYEIKGVSVVGVDSFHDDKEGAERGRNTLYNIQMDGVNVAHLGDLGQASLSNTQVEELGNVDILLIPVGGFFTIDASSAAKIAAQLEPKIVIPMHYQEIGSQIKELEGPEKFFKEMAKENVEKLDKLSISKEKFPEELKVIQLVRPGSS
ncbi:MAG: MBL fold metallo-hydrolase [bacterium]|nr:MBL fold metallo-hydrolase [bacterium]